MTERTAAVLTLLRASDRPMTGNEIGLALGFGWKAGKGGGPSGHINNALTQLSRKGLIQLAPRPDGLSGSAYVAAKQ